VVELLSDGVYDEDWLIAAEEIQYCISKKSTVFAGDAVALMGELLPAHEELPPLGHQGTWLWSPDGGVLV